MNVHAIEEVSDGARERAPVLAVRFGRGRTGGTTFLDFLVQRARRAGRAVMIADGDPKKGLANLYPPDAPGGAIRPRGTDIRDVMEWVTEVTSQMADAQSSMVLDMGAGDKVLFEHSKDMALPEFCGSAGVRTLPIYSLGPDSEDFDEVMNVFEAGYFRSERSLVVLNESLIKTGKGAGGAFDFIMSDPRLLRLAGSVPPVKMPRLACMDALRNEGLTFYEAAEGKRGKSGRPMSLGHQFMVKTWINKMERELVPISDWLP